MVKFIGNMSDEEIACMNKPVRKPAPKVVPKPQPRPEPEDDELFEMPDDKELGPDIWHQATIDRVNFDQKVTRPPVGKLGKLMSAISVDHPNDIRSRVRKSDVISLDEDDPLYARELEQERKKKLPIDDYDALAPNEVFRDQPNKKDRSWIREIAHIAGFVIHIVIVVGILYFAYYMISLVRDPGVTTIAQLSTLVIILSIQVALLSVNSVIGTVLKR